jgi:predicted MFS family arabinose efflux permease
MDTAAEKQQVASPVRNIALLSSASAIVGSNQVILAAIGGLTAAGMAPSPALVTLPVTVMIIGTALSTTPSAYLIHTWGRRQSFMFGAGITIPAAFLAALAVWIGNFVMFSVAMAVFGASAAFANQYRFAAADSVPSALQPRAISWVLFGGVLSGFLGPQLAILTRNWIPGHEFVACFLIMAGLAALGVAVLAQTRLAPTVKPQKGAQGGRPLRELLVTPAIIVPVFGATVAYALMILVMVAAPLAMVYVCGHSKDDAGWAIQWHVVAMFAPSFITGSIISRIGAHLTAGIGMLLIVLAALVNLHGISVNHFVVSLILLGVGWNFGFIASTALLTRAYRPEEAARVQGLNEQVVFGVMAIASIASGVLLEFIGWEAINILTVALAGLAIVTLAWSELRPRKEAVVDDRPA